MGLPTTIIFRNHLGFSHRVIKRTTVRLRQCATTLYMPWLHKKMPFYIYSKTCHLLHSTVRTLKYNAHDIAGYSRVHKSSDSFFSKILEKPSIVQKKMIPHIKWLDFSQI